MSQLLCSGKLRTASRLVAVVGITLLLPLAGASPVFGQDPAAKTPPAQDPAKDAPDASWWERFHVSGDFRTRFEMFRQQGMEDRNRGRIRFRVNVEADIDDEFAIGVRLATGNPLDPTTANQSFKEFLTRKPLSIHRAYLTYAPKAASGLKLGAGIFEPPVTMTNQIWDDNISWEGAYQQFGRTTATGVSVKVVAAQVVLSEVEAGKDALAFAESGEIGFKAGKHGFSVTVTDFLFKQADQVGVAVDTEALDTRNSNLSRRDAAGRFIGFVSGFHLVDVVGKAILATPNKEYPIVLAADWVTNLDAVDDQKTGIWLEATAGTAEKPGTFELNYAFARIQRDAVLSPYVFDDLERASNQIMHYAKVSYAVKRHVNIECAGIFAKPILVGAGQTRPTLSRVQFSTRVSF